jgi:molybdopterin/thiamine biosynthesis adenylyltransferase
MRIPGWDQSKLTRARVFIAGMGALGNEVAKNLALAGVGNLLVLDHDRVEYTNLNRAVLFFADDVGSYKVKAASRTLHRLNPAMRITAFNETLQKLLERSPKMLRTVDLLVGCLDNREARFILNHVSVAHRIPYVDGGMLNAIGSVRVSIPPYTPCLECGIPQSTYAQVGQRYRCEDVVFEDLTAKQMAVRHPTISTVTSVTAAIQSHEVLKILLGLDLFRTRGTWAEGTGKPVENEIQYDCRTNSFLTQLFHKDPECYVCGTHGSSIDPVKPALLRVAPRERIADFLGKVDSVLNTNEFDLVKGLKPFPDRSLVTMEGRNLFQKLFHLSRLAASRALDEFDARESFRMLRECLESSAVRRTQDMLRWGIQFRNDELVATLCMVRDAVNSLDLRTRPPSPDCLTTVLEINDMINGILNLTGNDLTLEECRLKNGDILCAIRHRENRLCDTAIEVTLEQQVEMPSKHKVGDA